MIKRVCLDLDGVIVMLVEGICRHHSKPYPYKEGEQGSWVLAPQLGMTWDECWGELGYEFWRNLKPYPYMREFVGLLEARFGPENICLLSAPIKTAGSVDGKLDWIREYLPDYVDRSQIGKAKHFCASPNSVLVDDNEDNIRIFRKTGGHTFLVPSLWNRRFREHPLVALKQWIKALEVLDKSRV